MALMTRICRIDLINCVDSIRQLYYGLSRQTRSSGLVLIPVDLGLIDAAVITTTLDLLLRGRKPTYYDQEGWVLTQRICIKVSLTVSVFVPESGNDGVEQAGSNLWPEYRNK